MAIGERIRFFRNLKGFTQKYLGQLVGFSKSTADIRIAQYESGTRTPKADLIEDLSKVFGVSKEALTVPNIDDVNGVMQTLFVLEDNYGITIRIHEGCPIIMPDPTKDSHCLDVNLYDWAKMADKYRSGEIDYDEYSNWRYNLKAFTTEK